MNADFFGVVFLKSLQKSLHSAFVPLHISKKNLCNSHILKQKSANVLQRLRFGSDDKFSGITLESFYSILSTFYSS